MRAQKNRDNAAQLVAPEDGAKARRLLPWSLDRIITKLANDISGVTVMALYMVLERFRNADAAPVYRRFRERGRMAPEGLNYISSWVTEDLSTCFQVMETANRALLEKWMSHWSDLVDFEIHPVITSKEAAERAET